MKLSQIETPFGLFPIPEVKENPRILQSTAADFPSLLLHNIHKPHKLVTEIEQQPFNTLVLFGPPGCGKTATTYQLLNRQFGFYLTCSTLRNGGNKMLENAIAKVDKICSAGHNLDKNSEIASAFTLLCIYSHVKLLHDALESSDNNITEFSWFLFHVYAMKYFDFEPWCRDILSVIGECDFLTLVRINDLLKQSLSKLLPRINNSKTLPLFIVVDEVQQLLRTSKRYRQSTIVGPESEKRAMFTPVVGVITNLAGFALILAGTGLEWSDLQNHASGLGTKPMKASSEWSDPMQERPSFVVIDFGGIEKMEDLRSLVVWTSAKLHRELTEEQWHVLFAFFKGRYRPCCFALQHLLKCQSVGDDEFFKAVNTTLSEMLPRMESRIEDLIAFRDQNWMQVVKELALTCLVPYQHQQSHLKCNVAAISYSLTRFSRKVFADRTFVHVDDFFARPDSCNMFMVLDEVVVAIALYSALARQTSNLTVKSSTPDPVDEYRAKYFNANDITSSGDSYTGWKHCWFSAIPELLLRVRSQDAAGAGLTFESCVTVALPAYFASQTFQQLVPKEYSGVELMESVFPSPVVVESDKYALDDYLRDPRGSVFVPKKEAGPDLICVLHRPVSNDAPELKLLCLIQCKLCKAAPDWKSCWKTTDHTLLYTKSAGFQRTEPKWQDLHRRSQAAITAQKFDGFVRMVVALYNSSVCTVSPSPSGSSEIVINLTGAEACKQLFSKNEVEALLSCKNLPSK